MSTAAEKAVAANKAAAARTTDEKESDMTEAKTTAKKTTSRKPAAKKPAAKKTAAKKGTRVKRTIKPMSVETRKFAASIVGFATEGALASEDLGVKRSSASELKQKNGQVARILLDDGTRISVTVRVTTK